LQVVYEIRKKSKLLLLVFDICPYYFSKDFLEEEEEERKEIE